MATAGWDIVMLAALVLATRLLPRWLNPKAVSSDSYYHLLCAQAIRENRFRIPEKVRGFCFPSPYDYPPLFHYLLALLGTRARERAEVWLSGVIDVGNVAVFYWLARRLDATLWAGHGPSPLMLSALLAISPALLAVGTGPRAYQATPRVLGEVWFNLAVAAALLFYLGDGWPCYAAAVAAAALVCLSSKFSVQALLFMLPVIGLLLKSPSLAALPLLGMGLAVVLSGGFYLRVLRGQIGHLYLFSRWTAQHYPNVLRKNRWQDIVNLPHYLLANRQEAYRVFFLDNSYVILLTRNPQLLFLGYGWLVGGLVPWGPPAAAALWAWAAASLAVFLLTSLRPLLFLGEPERYVEHALIPLYLLAGYAAWGLGVFDTFSAVTAAYSLTLYGLYVLLFRRLFRVDPEAARDQEEAFAFLRNWPGRLRLLPLGSIYGLAYWSGQEVFYSSGNFATCYMPIAQFRNIYKILGVPRENLRDILDGYGLDGFVAFKKALAAAWHDYGLRYSFAGLEKVFENDSCSVWLRRRPAADTTPPRSGTCA